MISRGLEGGRFELEDGLGESDPGVSTLPSKGGLLLASLLCRRAYSAVAFERAMLSAWAPLWGVSMTKLEENLFLFRFDHKIDLNKVLREGPWRFNQFLVVMTEVIDDSPVNRTLLTSVTLWVQTYGIPVLRQTEQVARFVGSLLGKAISVDLGPGGNRYPYLLIRVEVDIRGALPKGTTLVLNRQDVPVKFRYERLFEFCYWCGLLDHVLEDCEEFFEKGQHVRDCGYDESLRIVPPRQGYVMYQAARAPQFSPRPLLTNASLSRYGVNLSGMGSSGLVALPGFLPVSQGPASVGLVPKLALPEPTSALALLHQVSTQRPLALLVSGSSVESLASQDIGFDKYASLGSGSREESLLVFQTGATSPLKKAGKNVKIHRRALNSEKASALDLCKRKEADGMGSEDEGNQSGRKKRINEEMTVNLNVTAGDGFSTQTRLENRVSRFGLWRLGILDGS